MLDYVLLCCWQFGKVSSGTTSLCTLVRSWDSKLKKLQIRNKSAGRFFWYQTEWKSFIALSLNPFAVRVVISHVNSHRYTQADDIGLWNSDKLRTGEFTIKSPFNKAIELNEYLNGNYRQLRASLTHSWTGNLRPRPYCANTTMKSRD